jgi:GTP-binding protein LepA
MNPDKIRNFAIIAHIDHGKTTLSDRLLEKTNALTKREMTAQVLDDMDLEKERGITIKARAVALRYKAKDGNTYPLNLIDTPGHVDFTYEVSRALSACEGALLIVDASQGVEAQTLANAYLAVDSHLEIIPIINKIDLPAADPEKVREQIGEIPGVNPEHAILCSAKDGQGIEEILEGIVHQLPAPAGKFDAPPKALIFDSWYDSYRGVIMLVRVIDGLFSERMEINLMATKTNFEVEEIGIYTPRMERTGKLAVGEVGYIIANIKRVQDCQVGDTVTARRNPAEVPFPGFRPIKPMVFAGLYPLDDTGYNGLRDALEKLRLNDSSFFFEPESSLALGLGFRCGFLGLLHMEIIQARLEREFELDLLSTAPSVSYRVLTTSGNLLEISNPSQMPDTGDIEVVEEPIITARIITPPDYLGSIFALMEERRGTQKEMKYLTPQRVILTYELPLNEIVMDFYDKLKTISRGYASLDYKISGYNSAKLVKLDIMVNGETVDALSLIVHKEKAYARGRALAEKMRKEIPRQMFEVAIQASLGSRIIARETVKAMRKNVLAKCYGGDITRKRKLLENQKEGKKRMKRVGKVDIPQEAFLAVLRI